MENKWYYKDRLLKPEDIPEWAVGFIYQICLLKDYCPLIYIGKKSLSSTRKKKIGVRAQAKQKAETGDGRVKKVERITKSSGWENYWSSCKELQEAVKREPHMYQKDIIEWCYSKKNMTYLELKHQFLNEVLEKPTYNANINGSLYRHDTDRELYRQHLQKMRDKPRKPRVKKEVL